MYKSVEKMLLGVVLANAVIALAITSLTVKVAELASIHREAITTAPSSKENPTNLQCPCCQLTS